MGSQSSTQFNYDEELRLLILFGLVATSLITIGAIITLALIDETQLIIWLAVWLLSQIIAITLVRRGYMRLAGVVTVGTLMVILIFSVFVFGVVLSLTFIGAILVILVSGVMLPRALPIVAVVSVLVWVGQRFLQSTDIPVTSQVQIDEAELFVLQTSILIVSAFFYILLIRVFNRAINLRKAQAQALETTLDRLQKTTFSENYLDNILNSMNDMVIVTDLERRIRKINKRVTVRLGYSEKALMGQDIETIIGEGIKPLSNIDTNTHHHEILLRTQSNQNIPVTLNISVMRDEHGRAEGLILTAQDVSEIREMRHELERSNERYEIAIEASQGGVFEWYIDTNEFYIDPNMKHVLGYGDSEIGDNVAGFREIVHPDDLEMITSLLREVIKLREITFEVEFRLKHRQGALIWVLSRGRIFYDMQGKPVKIISANINITGRRLIEEILTRSEEQTRALIGALPDMIMRLDRHGRFLEVHGTPYVHPTLATDQLEGQLFTDVFPEEIAKDTLSRIDYVLQSGAIDIYEYQLEEYGVINHYEARMVAYDENEVLIIIRGTNERKQIERKNVEIAIQEEKVKLLARFVHDASHDFRTALTVITTGVYLLQRVDDPEKRKTRVEMIERQAVRLSRLFDSLFTMMRLDIAADLDLADVKINRIANEVVQRVEGSARPKQITITTDFIETQPEVIADEAELGQALINIMENAIHFTPEGGHVIMRTRENQSHVFIDIIDNGIGIPADEIPMIFERLYKVDKARSPDKGGLGLGLPIAQRVIELHHGEILVESTEGQGSKFTVKLPKADFTRATITGTTEMARIAVQAADASRRSTTT